MRSLYGLLFLMAAALTLSGQNTGRGNPSLPTVPVKTALPSFKPISGPGPMFTALHPLSPDEDLAHFKYIAKEYFVSGTAQGQPYMTRIVVRRPADPGKFSGIVVAEPMHPTGNDWMFYFLHTYLMSQGHAAVEIATGSFQLFTGANAERYKDLKLENAQVNEVLAQAGLLLKSKRSDGVLDGLPVRKIILTGTSASATTVAAYLPAHMVYRDSDIKPIFDGFLPTSIGGETTMAKVDVPMIQMPTMTEVVAGLNSGNRYRRPDGDAAGDQFRIYEVAGMAHIDSRFNPIYSPNPCKYPVSEFPEGMGLAAGLERLIQWIDKGKTAPRVEYVSVLKSEVVLDANGNPKGGIRNTYVDVPAYRYVSPNEPATPPIPNPFHVVSEQGPGGPQIFCGIAAYQIPLSSEQMKALYKSKKDFQAKVEQRSNALIREGWLSPAYKELVLADAAKVKF